MSSLGEGHQASGASKIAFDVDQIRRDFPILQCKIHGKPLVYLDNAATAQKPKTVLDALTHYYTKENANINRGVHLLSELATEAHEGARVKVQKFLNTKEAREVVFTRNATEGINLVAQAYGRQRIGSEDEIIISEMEHHSNIVPWQLLCEEVGARLRVIPVNDEGELRIDDFAKLLSSRTKFVSVVHLSNSLGTINPVHQIIEMAHDQGVPILIDGSQAVCHTKVDVQTLDCDFYVFTGHKLYGPTGIGVLYGKSQLLDAMPPYQGGGDMISSVTFKKTTYNDIPYKFEAGTPDIAGAIGLGAAIDFVTNLGIDRIEAYEKDLLTYATTAISSLPEVRLIGTAKEKASILSFIVEGVHPHDVGTILDREGVAIRTGHHCTQPLMQRFGVPATARASLAMYNTRQEIDVLIAALSNVHEVFG